MPKSNYVSWNATLHIWCAFAWRFGLGMVLQYGLEHLNEFYLSAWLLDVFLDFWVWQWAVRASLMDKYADFSLMAENKKTGGSIYNARGRIGFWVALRVWWALSWRVSLVPIALFFWSVMVSGQGLLDLMEGQEPPSKEYITDALEMLVSVWALRESLADRYRGFRFVTRPKGS